LRKEQKLENIKKTAQLKRRCTVNQGRSKTAKKKTVVISMARLFDIQYATGRMNH